MFRIKSAVSALAMAGALLSSATVADAASITYFGSTTNPDGNAALKASAAFAVVGSNLQVTLTNEASATAMRPSDLLAAVFFDVAGSPSGFGYVSGTAEAYINDNGSADNSTPKSVGSQWDFAYNASGLGSGVTQKYGLGGAGFGIFGAGVDGMDYLLVTSNFNGGGNLNSNKNPYIQNTITLLVSGIPVGFDPSLSISNIRFQWGTGLNEPFTSGCVVGTPGCGGGGNNPQDFPAPEPTSLLLLGSGLVGAVSKARRRLKAQ